MSPSDRRVFLKTSAAALTGVAASRGAATQTTDPRAVDADLLRAVGDVVLPAELGPENLERAVADFERWLDDFEPVAELNHGYGTSDIRYGPADPAPGWAAQLRALELETQQRHGHSFTALDRAARQELIRRQLDDADDGFPAPLRARHVAVALMAHYFASTDATDRCYGVQIGTRRCRGIDDARLLPAQYPGEA